MLLNVIIMSLVAGGAMAHSASRYASSAVILPMVIPFTMKLILIGTPLSMMWALLSAVFSLLFYARALRRRDHILDVLRLASDKEALALELSEAQARAQESSKMSALGHMAGGIAHEINNPLAMIQMRVSQLRRMIESDRSQKDQAIAFLQQVEETVARIGKITKGLRAIARDGSADQFACVQVLDIVQNAVSLCGEKFRSRGIDLKVSVDSSLSCECREVQIAQVILNLLNNAYDAVVESQPSLPEGSTMWIELRARQVEGRIEVSVADSGPGIPPEIVAKLMTPFFTTKAVGQGTGLGLSVSRSIAQEHDGSLELDPTSPSTKFVLKIPVRQKFAMIA